MPRVNAAVANAPNEFERFHGLGHVSAVHFENVQPKAPKDPKNPPKGYTGKPKLSWVWEVTPLDTEGNPTGAETVKLAFGAGGKALEPYSVSGTEIDFRMCPGNADSRDDADPAPCDDPTSAGSVGNCLYIHEGYVDKEGNQMGLHEASTLFKFGESLEAAGFSSTARQAMQSEEFVDAVLEFGVEEVTMDSGEKYSFSIVKSIIKAPNCPDFVGAKKAASKPVVKPGSKPTVKPAATASKPAAAASKPVVKPAATSKSVAAKPAPASAPVEDNSELITNFGVAALSSGALSDGETYDSSAFTRIIPKVMMKTTEFGGEKIDGKTKLSIQKELLAAVKDWENFAATINGASDGTLTLMVDENGDLQVAS